MSLPKLSNRSSALGTENAFVVLGEVTALQRAGKDIISFCIGQPDFPTPVNIQDAAVEAINGPQADAGMMKASFLKRRDLIAGLLNQVPGIHCLGKGEFTLICR